MRWEGARKGEREIVGEKRGRRKTVMERARQEVREKEREEMMGKTGRGRREIGMTRKEMARREKDREEIGKIEVFNEYTEGKR